MRRQGRGRVVLISSIGGIVGIPFQAFYSASKFAMEGYAEALAYEVAPFGVQVTMVEPGNVRTDFTASRRDVGGGADDPYTGAMRRPSAPWPRTRRTGSTPIAWPLAVERVLRPGVRPGGCRWASWTSGSASWASASSPTALFERAAKGSLGV